MCTAAARVRDAGLVAGLVAAGRAGVVTFSPKVFIAVTWLCRDRCHYCTFVTTPDTSSGQARRRTSPPTKSCPGTAYFDLVAAVKQRVPGMHVHAFSPMEIVNGANRTGLSVEDFLIQAREAGLDTIPGTAAAEILDDDVRWVLTKGKLAT